MIRYVFYGGIMQKALKWLLPLLIVLLVVSNPVEAGIENLLEPPPMSYSDFKEAVNNNKIDKIWYSSNEEKMRVVLYTDKTRNMSYEERLDYNDYPGSAIYTVPYPKTESFRDDMLSKGIILEVRSMALSLSAYLWLAIFAGLLITILLTMLRSINIGDLDEDVFIKPKDISTRFTDVIGHDEVIHELSFISNFIKHTSLGDKLDAKIPKGILFTGPPGTGKTLLARALAGECGVPFIYMNGSSFIDIYGGAGAKRARKLFKLAKKAAPCIVFIDEIDAVGGSREREVSSSEDRQTLNAILQEMDGFKSNNNVLVIAATNHPEALDKALVRAGRFDRQIAINPPSNWETRLKLFKYYYKSKPLDDGVNLETFAKSTAGFTGADINMVSNESALIALSNNREKIILDDIEEAIDKTLLKGSRRKNDKSEVKYQIICYHEAGHAVMHYLLKMPIVRISVQGSTSGVGGFVIGEDDDNQLTSRRAIEDRLKILYGGRISEEIKFGKENVTIGAMNDIQKATELIYQYASVFGFAGVELLDWHILNRNSVDKDIIETMKTVSREQADNVRAMLSENYDLVEGLVKMLQEEETLTGLEALSLFKDIEAKRIK